MPSSAGMSNNSTGHHGHVRLRPDQRLEESGRSTLDGATAKCDIQAARRIPKANLFLVFFLIVCFPSLDTLPHVVLSGIPDTRSHIRCSVRR